MTRLTKKGKKKRKTNIADNICLWLVGNGADCTKIEDFLMFHGYTPTCPIWLRLVNKMFQCRNKKTTNSWSVSLHVSSSNMWDGPTTTTWSVVSSIKHPAIRECYVLRKVACVDKASDTFFRRPHQNITKRGKHCNREMASTDKMA